MSLADLAKFTNSSCRSLSTLDGYAHAGPEYLRQQVPNDVFLRICDFLDVSDVVHLGETCTSLNRSCDSDRVWQQFAHRLCIPLCANSDIEPKQRRAETSAPGASEESNSVGIQCHARTHVKTHLCAPRQLMDGQYLATQKLARSAGFSRCVFTSVAVLYDERSSDEGALIACGVSNNSIRIFRLHDTTPATTACCSKPVSPPSRLSLSLQPVRVVDAVHDSAVLCIHLASLPMQDSDGGISSVPCVISAGADWNIVVTPALQASQPPRTLLARDADTPEHREGTSHRCPITSIAVHPSLPVLLSADELGIIKAWDLRRMELICELHAHSKTVSALEWCRDTADQASLFVSGSFDGSAVLWDASTITRAAASASTEPGVQSFDRVATLLHNTAGAYRVYDVAVSQTGKLAALACGDGTVRLCELDTVKGVIAQLPASNLWLKSVSFACYDTVLLAGGGDHRIRMWQLPIVLRRAVAARLPSEAFKMSPNISAGSGRTPTPLTPRLARASLSSRLATGTPLSARIASRNGSSMVTPSPLSRASVLPPAVDSSYGSSICKYLGTLDVHSGPILSVCVSGHIILSISTDESLVARRFLPWSMFKSVDRKPVPAHSDDKVFYIEDDAPAPAITAPKLQLQLLKPAAMKFPTLQGPCVPSPRAGYRASLGSPASAFTKPFMPLTVIPLSSPCPSAVSVNDDVDGLDVNDVPKHPQMPFPMESSAPERVFSRDSTHNRPPPTPTRRQYSGGRPPSTSLTSTAPLRMAGGPGAVAIFPSKLRRACWSQGVTYLEHISSLLQSTNL